MKLYTINPLYTSLFSVLIFAALTSSFSMLYDNGRTFINSKFEVVYGGNKTLNIDGMTLTNLKSYRQLTVDEQLKVQEIKRNRDLQREKEWKERDEARERERISREAELEKEREQREKERVQREKENEQREKEREQRENEQRIREALREKERVQREHEQRMREAEREKKRESTGKWNNNYGIWSDDNEEKNEKDIRKDVMPKEQIVKRRQSNVKRKEYKGKPAEPINRKQRRPNTTQNKPLSRGGSRRTLIQQNY
ncbi:zinc finger CCCH domain-containing protein 13-like isoform X2 [Myzus persicae]|uniref:zinc finger CCCH domain-containing protein 13-like isoform X2 n=1 Tax=Myzus persicae TaxID=13164 RepID=UPI000B936DD4|nr:zinc finger CCCH domain-containing protein 13-like isoform X2 [Myzus persicae]